ncbi:MAG: exonuclease subunit SbcD [Cytophagales bacterium]|nr:MAG: exonuclease subunit SbcD [Cytophagales bacterium]TAF61861.1 MAG: exonuclease subunit SbcD [Cytophagales bacterium]
MLPKVRVLHTADWHLGQKFLGQYYRDDEFSRFLDWLRDEVIVKQGVQVLIHSGDVFDIPNPPITATRLYFNFLSSLQHSCCEHVVIVGGNHDSPPQLNSAAQILECLNVYVRGHASDKPSDDLIILKDKQEQPFMVVCAVPFLRDRELYLGDIALDEAAHRQAIQKAIKAHYQKFSKLLAPYKAQGLPIIATGHLWVSGAEVSDASVVGRDTAERPTYMGTLADVGVDVFGQDFQYVALGHIHKSQKVGGHNHIRYAGSPIPLDFSERKQEKSVLIVDFEGQNAPTVLSVKVPVLRPLLRLEGTLATIAKKLEERSLQFKTQTDFQSWAELILISEHSQAADEEAIKELTEKYKNAILFLSKKRKKIAQEGSDNFAEDDFFDLTARENVLHVFEQFCLSKNINSEEKLAALKKTFEQVFNELSEKP